MDLTLACCVWICKNGMLVKLEASSVSVCLCFALLLFSLSVYFHDKYLISQCTYGGVRFVAHLFRCCFAVTVHFRGPQSGRPRVSPRSRLYLYPVRLGGGDDSPAAL